MARIGIEKRFGESVKEFRKQLGMTQEGLSQGAGLHRYYISELERGRRNVSLKNVEKLANALGVSVSALFYRSPAPSPSLEDSRPSNPAAAASGHAHSRLTIGQAEAGILAASSSAG